MATHRVPQGDARPRLREHVEHLREMASYRLALGSDNGALVAQAKAELAEAERIEAALTAGPDVVVTGHVLRLDAALVSVDATTGAVSIVARSTEENS
jgi:hypothetical protein